jgi:hypothetical protein
MQDYTQYGVLTEGWIIVVVRVPQRKSGSAVPIAHNRLPLRTTSVNAQTKALSRINIVLYIERVRTHSLSLLN